MNAEEFYVPDRSAIAITSMARVDRQIYLGLTGGARILAVYDIDTQHIQMAGEIFPWISDRGYCSKVHNALGVRADGSLLLGEGNHFTWDGLPVTMAYFDTELPERMLKRKRDQGFPDVSYADFCLPSIRDWNRTRDDPGGKVVSYTPATRQCAVVAALPPFLYVQSMIVDAAHDRAYGHTLPENRFFSLDLKTGVLEDHGRISDFAHHNMVVTPSGICYGGWIDKGDGQLKLLRYNPEENKLHHLDRVVSEEIGPKVAGNQGIDQWIVTRSGRIFMGMVDRSKLFEFHPEDESFESLGSLSAGGRMTTMDEDVDGTIWLGVDYPHMRLVRFDPKASGKSRFTDCGRVNTSYERCYFHASCLFEGALYLGETDGFSPSLHVVDLKTL